MKILEVTFDCTIAMPGYNNVKPGVFRAILEEGDTLEGAWTELNRRAQAWHKKEYPHLYQEVSVVSQWQDQTQPPSAITTTATPLVINRKHEELKDLIDDCSTIEELKAWKEANPVLPVPVQKHYDTKVEILRIERDNKLMGKQNSINQ